MIHSTHTHPGVNATLLAISRAKRDRCLALRVWGDHPIIWAHDKFIGRLYGKLARINGAHAS